MLQNYIQKKPAGLAPDPYQTLIDNHEADLRSGTTRKYREKLVREGKFPKPVKIGPRSVRYVLGEVLDWVEERKAQREAS